MKYCDGTHCQSWLKVRKNSIYKYSIGKEVKEKCGWKRNSSFINICILSQMCHANIFEYLLSWYFHELVNVFLVVVVVVVGGWEVERIFLFFFSFPDYLCNSILEMRKHTSVLFIWFSWILRSEGPMYKVVALL